MTSGVTVKKRISYTELKYILRKQGILKPDEKLGALESDGFSISITIVKSDEEIHVS